MGRHHPGRQERPCEEPVWWVAQRSASPWRWWTAHLWRAGAHVCRETGFALAWLIDGAGPVVRLGQTTLLLVLVAVGALGGMLLGGQVSG